LWHLDHPPRGFALLDDVDAGRLHSAVHQDTLAVPARAEGEICPAFEITGEACDVQAPQDD